MKKQLVIDPFQVMKDFHGPLNDRRLLSWWCLHSRTKVKVLMVILMESGRLVNEIVIRYIPPVLLDAQRAEYGYLCLAIREENTW